MGKRSLLSIISLLVWIAASNHCFLEYLVSSSSAVAASGISEEGTPSGTKCPLHSEEDTTSHEDGKPCGGAALTNNWAKLGVTDTELLPILSLPLRVSLVAPTKLTPASVQSDVGPLLPFSTRPFLSLSIASNAPPRKLA